MPLRLSRSLLPPVFGLLCPLSLRFVVAVRFRFPLLLRSRRPPTLRTLEWQLTIFRPVAWVLSISGPVACDAVALPLRPLTPPWEHFPSPAGCGLVALPLLQAPSLLPPLPIRPPSFPLRLSSPASRLILCPVMVALRSRRPPALRHLTILLRSPVDWDPIVPIMSYFRCPILSPLLFYFTAVSSAVFSFRVRGTIVLSVLLVEKVSPTPCFSSSPVLSFLDPVFLSLRLLALAGRARPAPLALVLFSFLSFVFRRFIPSRLFLLVGG